MPFKKHQYRLLVAVLLFINTGYSQQVEYAKAVIGKLCSPAMKGRGYVENGDGTAAAFIEEEFKILGLKKFSKSYLQHFTTPVNSFPGKMTLKVNGQSLKPGEDFLIEPGSPGVSGQFKVEVISPDDLLDQKAWTSKVRNASGSFVAINAYDKAKYSADQLKKINEVISFLQYSKDNPAKGTLVLTNEKLTWSGSTEVSSKPSFTVRANAVNGSISNIEVDAENKFVKNYKTQNVIGYIEGSSNDSLLVFTAHYDHLGMMGKETIFPGANDNASGVSMLLNVAKYFSTIKPKYSIVFIAFAAEEIGLIGSSFFTEHPIFPLAKIKFLINFDLAGTGDDGIQVVNGRIYQKKFDLITKLNEENKLLKQIKIRGEACNSDHCLFHSKGVPCFYIYTLGGIQAYHDINDRAETLPLTDYQDYFSLLIKFVQQL